MNKSNPQCRVRQCFICDNDTVFFCFTCKQDLCESCRDNHLQDISTTYHDTVLYKLSKQRHGNYFSIFSTLPSTLSSSSIKIRTIRRRQAIMLKMIQYFILCLENPKCVCQPLTYRPHFPVDILLINLHWKSVQHIGTMNMLKIKTISIDIKK